MPRISSRPHPFFHQVAEDLKLYVQHQAWLQAIPEDKDGSNKDKKQRHEILSEKDEDHPLLTLPPLESHSYMIEWLFDVGPGIDYGRGLCPLTYQEINAWTYDMDISAWERKTLKMLSHEYISWSNKATQKGCIAPYIEDTGLPDKKKSDEIANSLSAMFRGMSNIRNGGLK